MTLLHQLQQIEKALKRKRTVVNGPRTIDLDILIYGDEIFLHPRLMIPHPRLHQREFVLRGFCEIAPDVTHPLLKKSIRDLYAKARKRYTVNANDQEHTKNGSMHSAAA